MDKKPERLCPICQRPNDADAERCWYCQAVLPRNDQENPEGNSDWLDGLREDSSQAGEPQTEASSTPAPGEQPEEVPDWLARIRTREQLEHENDTAADKAVTPAEPVKEDLPDWLKEIKAGNSGSKPEAAQAEQTNVPPFEASSFKETYSKGTSDQENEDDTQEWLSKLASWQPSESDQQENQSTDIFSTEPKTDKSEQYRGIEAETPQTPEEPLSEPTWKSFEELGLDKSEGWQNIFPEEEASAQEETGAEQEIKKTPAITPDHSESAFDFDAFRGDATDKKESPAPAKGTPEPPTKESDKSINGKPAEDKAPESPDTSPFVPDDLPDWLATATLSKPEKKEESDTEIPDASSSEKVQDKSKLPAWLQSVRPSVPEAFTEIDENAAPVSEEKGLLAGISGTLHSPEGKANYRKPVGYGSALKVSDQQKANAALFGSLVEDSFEDEEESGHKNGKTLRILFQILLGIVLVAVMYASKTYLSNYTIQPALFAPEVVSVFDTLNSIPGDKPVLLAADFEAATYGELSWSSQTLLEHIMRRNLNVVLLSSNPAGTTMLSQQMQSVNQKISNYDLQTQMVNLGYLAGGSTGMQSLSGGLRSALPYTHDFVEAWKSPFLQSVQSLSDFGAVIVISDNAERTRFWIEQIDPGLANTPLMFVISAQAAPLLQPYYQSGQVSGFIAGFNGSLSYEQVFGQPSVSSAHLSSFQAALLFLALLILVGGLVALVRPDPTDRKG